MELSRLGTRNPPRLRLVAPALSRGAGRRGSVFRRFVILAAVGGSVIVIAAWILGTPWHWIGMDYRTFFTASRTPDATLYQGPDYTFIYPPTAIPALRLLSFADYWTGFFILGVTSALCFYFATWRVADHKVALLSLLSLPALQGLLWGQVPMLLTAALLAALALRDDAKGLIIGVLISLKPQLFFVAPAIFLIRGETRTTITMIIGAALSLGCSVLLFGLGPWRDWFAALPHLHEFLVRNNAQVGMISLPGFAVRMGLPMAPFVIVGLLISASLVWQSRHQSDPIVLAAMIGGASIMASPYALTHDAIILVPAAAACLLAARGISAAAAVGVYAGTVIPLAVPGFLLFGPFRRTASLDPNRVHAN